MNNVGFYDLRVYVFTILRKTIFDVTILRFYVFTILRKTIFDFMISRFYVFMILRKAMFDFTPLGPLPRARIEPWGLRTLHRQSLRALWPQNPRALEREH